MLSAVVSACANEQVTWSRPRPALEVLRASGYRDLVAGWEQEFETIRMEAVPLLAAMFDQSNYLPTVARRTSLGMPGELQWDPPIDPTWEAIGSPLDHLVRRAEALHAAVSGGADLLPDWRLRRTLAEATHTLVGMTHRMQEYYARASRLSPDDDDMAFRPVLRVAADHWSESEVAWRRAAQLLAGGPAR